MSNLQALLAPNRFDPASAKRTFRVAMSDYSAAFLPVAVAHSPSYLHARADLIPTKRSRFDFRDYRAARITEAAMKQTIETACLPADIQASDFAITGVVVRPKDGGVFVKYTATAARPDKAISQHLRAAAATRWLGVWPVAAYPVRGRPWLEDMDRFPSKKIKVEFYDGAGVLGQQVLHSLFKPYGRIANIDPQPSTCAERPRHAFVRYKSIAGAVAARNCLDGFVLDEMHDIPGPEAGVRLRILYEPAARIRWVRESIAGHSKLAIPVLVLVVGTVFYGLFDPIRVWFVELEITGLLDYCQHLGCELLLVCDILGVFPVMYSDNSLIGRMSTKMTRANEHNAMDPRETPKTIGSLRKLTELLGEDLDRPIVIVGCRRDKLSLILQHKSLNTRDNILVIDCRPIVEAVDKTDKILRMAKQVGFSPVFPTLSMLFDLVLHVAMGPSNDGIRKPMEDQLDEILLATRMAFRKIALRKKKLTARFAEEKVRKITEKQTDSTAKGIPENDDAYLRNNPGKRPILILENFCHNDGNGAIYEKLAEW